MITSYKLQQIGYNPKEAYSIMDRLRKLNCKVKQIKINADYIRKGVMCNYLHFCDAIDTKEAITVLSDYLDDLPRMAVQAKWKAVLHDLNKICKDE